MHLKVKYVVFFRKAVMCFRTLKAACFIVRAIINCRDLNAFISGYDPYTNTYQEIISNRVQVLRETETANIDIPLRNESSTFKGGLNSPVSLS